MTTSRAVALVLFASLAACGTDDKPTPPATVSGVVEIDGPVASATVFLDLDHNNLVDAGEPQTTVDATGHFTLAWDSSGPEQADTIGAVIDPSATRFGLGVHLRAPLGDTVVISPLTTLVTSEMEADSTLGQAGAQAKVASALSVQPADVTGDVSANPQLARVAGAVAALAAAAVAKGNALQSEVDCNDASMFDPAIVALDKQLPAIAAGTASFAQLTASEQSDMAQNPGSYPGYFIDTTALANDIESELVAAADELAAALFQEFEDEFAQQLEDECVEIVVEELLG